MLPFQAYFKVGLDFDSHFLDFSLKDSDVLSSSLEDEQKGDEEDSLPLGAGFGLNFVTYSEYLMLKAEHEKTQVRQALIFYVIFCCILSKKEF